MTLQYLRKVFAAAKRLYGDYTKQIIGLVLLSVVGGFISSIGIAALIPLFSYVVDGSIQGEDPVSKFFAFVFNYFDFKPRLSLLLIVISSLFVIKAVVLAIFVYIRTSLAASYELGTRSKLYRQILISGWPYLSKQKLGYLQDTLMSDVGAAGGFLKNFCGFILNFSSFLMYVVTALSINPFIVFITLSFGGATFLLMRPLMKKIKSYGAEGNQLKKEIAHQINENVLGAKTVKVMSAGGAVWQNIRGLFERLMELSLKFRLVNILSEDPIEPMSMIFIGVVFAFSYSSPGFNLAAFLVTMYLIKKIMDDVEKIRTFVYKSVGEIPSINRVIKLQEELDKNPEMDEGKNEFEFTKTLEVRRLTFDYGREDMPTLSDISFKINKGETIGIIGPSGAGKTTLADLFLRLLRPASGEIVIDGKNIDEIKIKSWRRNAGYVSQDIFLKNDTIENNIKFYDLSVSDVDMIAAAKTAQCHDFISELPKGFKTEVGERGAGLSGGQRQRIVLARALARKPQILILDEATSSVDNQSEALIKQAISDLKGKITIIIIAHRLSTIMDADRVFYLDKGKIIEEGAPADLLKDPNSAFYKMYNTNA